MAWPGEDACRHVSIQGYSRSMTWCLRSHYTSTPTADHLACQCVHCSLLRHVTMAQQLSPGSREEAPSRWTWVAVWHEPATALEIQLYIVQLTVDPVRPTASVYRPFCDSWGCSPIPRRLHVLERLRRDRNGLIRQS